MVPERFGFKRCCPAVSGSPDSSALCGCSPWGLLKQGGAWVREGTLLRSQASLVAF